MSEPRPTTRCRRCGHPFRAHTLLRDCPDGTGRTFQRLPLRPGASQSFSPAEIATLEVVLDCARRVGVPGTTSAALDRLAAKVLAMRKTARERDRLRHMQGVRAREAKAS